MSTPTLSILKLPAAYIFQFQNSAQNEGIGGLFASVLRNHQLEQFFQQHFEHQTTLLNQYIVQLNASQSAPTEPTYPERADAKASDPLLPLGRLIYQQLIPASIQNALAALPPNSPLLILTNDAVLPWELAHDNEEYLALKFQLTRQLLSENRNHLSHPKSLHPHHSELNVLLIGNPTGDLPESSIEITQIAELLKGLPQVASHRILMRHRASKESILAALASGSYQIIHYSGHAHLNPQEPNRSGLLLANREFLTTEEIRRVLGGSPFIFLNGCESAKEILDTYDKQSSAGTDGVDYVGGAMQGFAAAFVQGGAKGVIGSFWPILDQQSRNFAITFYQQLFAGQPVAAALQKTRLRSRHHSSSDPQWAAYTLVGPPNLELVQPERQELRPVTVMAAKFPLLTQSYATRPLEEAASLEAQIRTLAVTVTQRFGGTVVSFHSHILLVHFGLPRTHEDNADRAMRAALELLEGFKLLWPQNNALPQVAICSGDVLCFTGAAESVTLDSPAYGAVEARALTIAGNFHPGQISVDLETKRQARAPFRFLPLASHHTGDDAIYELEIVQADFLSQPQATNIAFVGREQEISSLQHWWEEARSGQGRLVHIVGQPGIGKSRLMDAFHAQLTTSPHRWIEIGCRSYDQQRPFALLEQFVLELADIRVDDDEAMRRTKLEKLVRETVEGLDASLDEFLNETLALVGPLIGLSYPVPTIQNLDSALRIKRLTQIGQALLGYLAQAQPMILVIDDLQWIDETSLIVLEGMASVVDQMPLLLLTAHRPDWTPDWHGAGHHRHLVLGGLHTNGRRELISQLLQDATIPDELLTALTDKIGDNPLFLIEVVNALRQDETLYTEKGGWKLKSALETLTLPQSIEHLVQARMDQLSGQGRDVLQHAAVIGSRFRQDVLREIQQHRERNELEHSIGELSRREFIRSTFALSTTYIFSHTLIHQAIYDNIVEQIKRALHRIVAVALQRLSGEKALDQLAHHYYFSDDYLNGVRFSLLAAERAHREGANKTALLWSRRALEKLVLLEQGHLTDFDETDNTSLKQLATWRLQALELQGASHSALGQNVLAIVDFDTALAIANLDTEVRAELLRKKAVAHHDQGELELAWQVLEESLHVLQGSTSPTAGRIHAWRSIVEFRRGQVQNALDISAKAVDLLNMANTFESQRDRAQALNLQGVIWLNLAKSEKAIQAHQASLDAYTQIAYMPGMERASSNLGVVYQDLGRWREALHCYEQSKEMAQKSGEERRLSAAFLNLGEIYRRQGNFAAAETQYEDALAIASTYGLVEIEGMAYLNRAAVRLKTDDYSAASEFLNRASAIFASAKIDVYAPELLRYRAELALAHADVDNAIQLAQQAVEQAVQIDQMQLGQTHRTLGVAFHQAGLLAEAKEQLEHSLTKLQEQDSRYEVALTELEIVRLGLTNPLFYTSTDIAATLNHAIEAFRSLAADFDLQIAVDLQSKLP